MFESISGKHRAVPHRGTVPLLISSALHVVVIGALAAVPLVYFNAELPEVPDMLAFVAAPPPPPAATTTSTASCSEGGHASEAEAEARSDERRTPSACRTARGDDG